MRAALQLELRDGGLVVIFFDTIEAIMDDDLNPALAWVNIVGVSGRVYQTRQTRAQVDEAIGQALDHLYRAQAEQAMALQAEVSEAMRMGRALDDTKGTA